MNTLILIFYKIATFFTRVTAKTRRFHAEFNTEAIGTVVAESKTDLIIDHNPFFINRQSNLSDIPYGKTNMSFGGCGPIAIYNALISLDIVPDMNEIITYLEKYGIALGGKLGTSPFAVSRYIKSKMINYSVCRSVNPNKLNLFAKDYQTFITVIMNNSKSISNGLHFICTVKDESGNFITHNPLHTSDSLYGALSMCSSHKIKNIYTLGIRNQN